MHYAFRLLLLPDRNSKDLGALPRTPLENFLKEVFKTFKNFNRGGFYPYIFVVRIFL